MPLPLPLWPVPEGSGMCSHEGKRKRQSLEMARSSFCVRFRLARPQISPGFPFFPQGKLILGITSAAKISWKMPLSEAKQQLLKCIWEGTSWYPLSDMTVPVTHCHLSTFPTTLFHLQPALECLVKPLPFHLSVPSISDVTLQVNFHSSARIYRSARK